MPGRFTHNAIRLLVLVALSVALLGSFMVPVPAELPAASFEQSTVYRLEIALLVFYGLLLLITPVHSALVWGRLPIEISTRGAKFAERAELSADLNQGAIEKLELASRTLRHELVQVDERIKGLEDLPLRDIKQPEVDSDP